MLAQVVFVVVLGYDFSVGAHFAGLDEGLADVGARGLAVVHFLVDWVKGNEYGRRI